MALTIEFDKTTKQTLEKCRGSVTDVLHRAIELYSYLEERVIKGDKVALVDKEGNVKEVIEWE